VLGYEYQNHNIMFGEPSTRYASYMGNTFRETTYDEYKSAPQRYLRTQDFSRILFYQQILQHILYVQGEIHLLGVANGSTLFTLAHLIEILEPLNTSRRIVAFDTFNTQTNGDSYYPISPEDGIYYRDNPMPSCTDYEKLASHVEQFNGCCRIHPERRIILMPGDARKTYIDYMSNHSPLISLVLLHIELYEVEKVVLRLAWKNMPKDSLVVSSTLGYNKSPGILRYMQELDLVGDYKICRTQYTSKMAYIIK